jgi:hypothetical protein
MWLIETEPEGELSGILIEVRFEQGVTGIPKFLLHGAFGEFASEPREKNTFLSLLQVDVTIAEKTHSRSTEFPCGFSDLPTLRRQIPGGSD